MNGKQQQTPLFTQLCTYIAQNPTPFHIPGHKKGMGMDPAFSQFLGENTLAIDLINIPPLDNLHQPEGVIREAQALAASAFGADDSFFSVQGTTGAILTMILAACQPGDQLILPRNVHRSVVSALILADVNPLFLWPNTSSYLNITDVPKVDQIEQFIQKYPDSKAIFLVHPTYLGIASDLAAIVKLAHQYQLPVLVDEAHGVLNYFHPDLPVSSMEAGADLAAVSIHKSGGSLTQSSILHLQGLFIDANRVQTMINLLTTTSTSYLLLASLDTARRHLALHGHELAEQVLRFAKQARTKIEQIPGISCYRPKDTPYDPSKLVIQLDELSINGFAAANWLRENYQIEVELSDQDHLLCMITIGDTEASISRLLIGLMALSDQFYQSVPNQKATLPTLPLPELVLSPRTAFYHKQKNIPLEQAMNQICGQTILSYPPGVPILIPGEKITDAHIAYIKQQIANGQTIQGIDQLQQTIQIVA